MPKIITLAPYLFATELDTDFTPNIELQHTPDSFCLKTSITYRFSDYPHWENRKEILFWTIQAFKAWSVGKKGASRKECFQGLKDFFNFLHNREEQIQRFNEVTPPLIDEFDSWLKVDGLRRKNEITWKSLNLIIKTLRNLRPQVLHPETYPRQMQKRTSRGSDTAVFRNAKQTLSDKTIRDIETACRRKIDSYRKFWEEGKRLMREAQIEGYDGTTLPPSEVNNLGALLLYLQDQWISTGFLTSNENYSRLRMFEQRPHYKQWYGLNGVKDCLRYFLPTHTDLVPYLLITLSRTGGNPTPIFDLTRDCLSSPPNASEDTKKETALFEALYEKRTRMWFMKGRTGKIQICSFDSTSKYAPTTLIREVIEMTEISRLRAKGSAANKVWIFDSSADHGITRTRPVSFSFQLNQLFSEIGITEVTPRLFRNTLLNAAVSINGNISDGQHLAGHSSPATMHKDYLAGPGRAKLNECIAKLQNSMLNWIESGINPEPADFGTISINNGSAIDSIIRSWIAAFTDPKVIVGGLTERCVKLLQMNRHLLEARPRLHEARWLAGFGQLNSLIEGILPKFPQDVRNTAEEVIKLPGSISPLPPIE